MQRPKPLVTPFPNSRNGSMPKWAQIFSGFREPGVHDAVTPKSLPPLLPEPRNVEMPKWAQRLWLMLFPPNVFGASRFRESGLHVSRLLASRPPGSRNAEIYPTTVHFLGFQNSRSLQFRLQTVLGPSISRTPKCRNVEMAASSVTTPCSKNTSHFMTLGFSMQSAPAPCHRDCRNSEPRNARNTEIRNAKRHSALTFSQICEIRRSTGFSALLHEVSPPSFHLFSCATSQRLNSVRLPLDPMAIGPLH
jgi:hypothetical protein